VKFLIAGDAPANLHLLRADLESAGHQVVEAANGVEAVAVLERESVDAVITDILMPSMDGFRLCGEIRKSTRSYRDVPVILHTATYDSPSDRALAETVGADGYIVKPAPAAVLIDAVQATVRNASVRSGRKAPGIDEAYVLERYDAALVRKLEARNSELHESLASLRAARAQIAQLNGLLETQLEQRTAALAAAHKELDSFSFTVSHDLRAPLRRISGFAQLLEEAASSALDGEHLIFLRQIIDGAVQMDQLIEALLDFYRTARTEPSFGEVDLETLLDETLVLFHSALEDRRVEWLRSALPIVRGDKILLRRVFVNLLSNAIKYTRTREHALIEIGVRPGREHEIVVFVRDNGVGFDMRYSEKLFGVFQRMHRADEFEGAGIGLATAQRIVTRHGGSIWAEAEAGRGATFFFSLPKI
jgi:two-component system sensor histidine kinase/response regulator